MVGANEGQTEHCTLLPRTYLCCVHDAHCVEALKVSHDLGTQLSGMAGGAAPSEQHVVDGVHGLRGRERERAMGGGRGERVSE
jgi:hypothetical protein